MTDPTPQEVADEAVKFTPYETPLPKGGDAQVGVLAVLGFCVGDFTRGEANELRRRFREFVGEERQRNFVRQFNS